MMDLGGALLSAMAARQRLRLGRALRRACIAAGLLLFAFVLVVIALVLLAWSGFYLLLPQLGPAGAALVVGLIALGLAAIIALIAVLAGRGPRRRRAPPPAAGRAGGGRRDGRPADPAGPSPPRLGCRDEAATSSLMTLPGIRL
jgi:hypothetical protein